MMINLKAMKKDITEFIMLSGVILSCLIYVALEAFRIFRKNKKKNIMKKRLSVHDCWEASLSSHDPKLVYRQLLIANGHIIIKKKNKQS